MKKSVSIPSVKIVHSKGKEYCYFRTGVKDDDDKEILHRLPDRRNIAAFSAAYSRCVSQKEKAKTAISVVTIAKLIDKYQRSDRYANLRKSTKKSYDIYLRRLEDLVGCAPAHELEPRDVVLIMEKMKPGAANLFKSAVGALYAFARSKFIVPHKCNPIADIDVNETGSHEPWPDAILELALQSNSDRLRLSVALLYYTGQRIGDVCRMRWSDFKDGYLTLTQKKTRKTLTIAVHPALQEELSKHEKRIGTVICNKKTFAPVTDQVIRRDIKKFGEAHGIDLVPHGLRKNAVNSLLEFGCSIREVQSVTGQSMRMVEYYAQRINNKKISAIAIKRWAENKT